jgi:hypothetical protein
MPDLTFYETVATVLPVLYLALLFQANLLEQPPLAERSDDGEKKLWLRQHLEPRVPWLYGRQGDELLAVIFAFYLLFVTGVGEFICLRALYVHRMPSHEARSVVALSFYVSVLTLTSQQTVIALSKRRDARDESDGITKMRGWATAVYLVLLVVGVILIAA